jgi:hypothetical protein
MAGYSGTPLDKKLGLSHDTPSAALHTPDNYAQLLPDYPELIHPTHSHQLAWLHAFYTSRKALETEFPALKKQLTKNGQLWISWPKQAARMDTDIHENIVRDIGLKCGLVDVKVAAIDEAWSGLKFVYRVEDR